MDTSVTCDNCGRVLEVGDFPFCPHGRSALATHPDDVPGGFWVENGFAQPQKFYSHSAHEKALDQEGYEIRAKWAGPNDQHLTRWDAVDLDSAKVLVTRNVEAWRARQAVITVRDGERFREKDLDVDVQKPDPRPASG